MTCTAALVSALAVLAGSCGSPLPMPASAHGSPASSSPSSTTIVDSSPAPAPSSSPSTTNPNPIAPASSLLAVAPADVTSTAIRIDPPTTTTDPCVNPAGLNCLPFADGLTGCDELNFYREQWGIPIRWGDQPRSGPKSRWGIGWRESNCDNTANSRHSAECCFGWWQIASSNITAPGYRAAGVFSNCGVSSKWDYWGNEPIQKQRIACVTRNLIDFHLARGEDPAYEVWDRWL